MVVALILAKNQAAAASYYARFPREPIKAPGQFVDVTATKMTKDDQLATLLDAIIRNVARGGNVVVVCHGVDLALMIKVGGRTSLALEVMRILVYAMDGKIADADMPNRLGFDKATGARQWADLKKLIQGVWNLRLNRVDFRACQIGKSPAPMYFLQRLFNCNVYCAPKGWDVFGSVSVGKPTQNEQVWKQWLERHRKATIVGAGADRFALQYEIGGSVKMEVLAASDDAAQAWVRLHLPPGNYRTGDIFYHAVTPDYKTLIFAGDAGYRDQLVEAAKGDPEPQPSLSAPP
jgi:hypothetical protein